MTIRADRYHLGDYGRSFAKAACKVCNQVEEKHMRWLYRFGLCLGLDLVIAVFVLCVLFMALEPRAAAGVGDGEGVAFTSEVDIAAALGQKNKIRIVHPAKGAYISGKIRIKLKVGQKIKSVFVFIDDRYFASGPPYTIFWNSAAVSNGPHRITVAAATTALSPDALFLASQSQDTTNFFVHNKPKVSPTPTPLPTASPQPTPLGGITPPALVNPQNPISHGADSTGTYDSTTAFANALSAGDVHVTAGHYLITGHLYFPSNRHMQCDPGSYLQNPSTSGYQMIDMGSTTNSSIFYCGFRGPNADINGVPSTTGGNQPFFIRISGPNGSNNEIVGNDFNGIGGVVGAINVCASDTQQPPPDGTVISWNTFEHCGYYAVQVASSTNGRFTHNILNDCSGFIEASDTGQANTGNLVDSNHLTFTYGVGNRAIYGAPYNGFDGLTCGAAPNTFNYGGDTCSNNIVDGTHSSTILTTGWTTTPPKYINNTCTGGCVVNNYGG